MLSGGTQLVTSSGIVGTSGSPVRVYSVHILSGATAGIVQLRNGTTASDTIRVQETGNSNDGKTINYGVSGTFFPSGCYCSIDGNVTSVAVNFVQQ